jgi:hypothetical protein
MLLPLRGIRRRRRGRVCSMARGGVSDLGRTGGGGAGTLQGYIDQGAEARPEARRSEFLEEDANLSFSPWIGFERSIDGWLPFFLPSLCRQMQLMAEAGGDAASGLQAAATRWDGWRPPCPPPCAVDLRREGDWERDRAGGSDGRRLRGGREWNTSSRVRDRFIRSKHDFSHWIDDRWSIIAGPVGLKRS